MKRVKYVIANWKMNGSSRYLGLVKNINLHLLKKTTNSPKVIICPPFTLIKYLSARNFSLLKFGGQDVHFKESGAFTGSVSASMLKDIKAKYVIIGHSERRQYQKESIIEISQKIKSALDKNLKIIFCLGEKSSEIKKRFIVLKNQLRSLPHKFNQNQIIIAYEPVWAIGTGKTPSLKDINLIHLKIRNMIKKYVGEDSNKISIIYGGSVNSSNSVDILSLEHVDGALVGGASLNFIEFRKIIDS